jgi:hypothetical protein
MNTGSLNLILNIATVLLGGTALGVVLRYKAKIKEIEAGEHGRDRDAEARLRDSLIARVEKLELRLERQQVRSDAEKRLLIHKLRNMTANFDSMLLMLEMNPDRGPEIVAKIKQQRAAQMMAEAKEAAIINAADLAPIGEEEGERG